MLKKVKMRRSGTEQGLIRSGTEQGLIPKRNQCTQLFGIFMALKVWRKPMLKYTNFKIS